MKLYVLFAQRVCSYPGEYAPEALEICDEYTMEVNSEWMQKEEQDIRDNDEFTSCAVIEVDISSAGLEVIVNRLSGIDKISGKVK